MSENLMCSAHKGNSEEYRDGWERVFGCTKDECECTRKEDEEEEA